jgi:hypothetical protein
MSYSGQQKVINLGRLGLMSDLSEDTIPADGLIRCENVQFKNGIIERADEVTDWMYATPGYQTPDFVNEKPIAVKRYNPEPRFERQIVVTDKGRVYKYINGYNRIEVTPTNGAPDLLSIDAMPMIVIGGNEDQGEPKKVFIFTGNSPIQVIEGDGTTRRNLTTPSPDWATSYPSFGFIFRNRLFAMGNRSNPDQVYSSLPDDHENFDPLQQGVYLFPVFPGESEGVISGLVYKGKAFVFKKPFGVYMLNDDDVDPANWFFQKTSGSFGIASPLSFFEGIDVVFLFSNDGSIISMTAAFRLGDVYNADLLSALKNANIFEETIRTQFLYNSFATYLPKRKIGVIAFPSYKSRDGYCDSAIYIDFNAETPRISWHRYDGYEITAADRYKDVFGNDEFLFCKLNFDGNNYLLGRMATYYPAYTPATPFRIQTAHANLDTEANKLFDGFELMFESTSAYPLAVDVYIDSKFSNTFLIQPYFGGVLGDPIFPGTTKLSSYVFELDKNYALGRGNRPKFNSLSGRGQTISFVIRDGVTFDPVTYNPVADDFNGGIYPVKISGVRVYYRIAGQDQKSQTN